MRIVWRIDFMPRKKLQEAAAKIEKAMDELVEKAVKKAVKKPAAAKAAAPKTSASTHKTVTRKAAPKAAAVAAAPAASHDDVARLAYSLWLERGCEHGHEVEDWLCAETLLVSGGAAKPAK
jgi:hypothetical protein